MSLLAPFTNDQLNLLLPHEGYEIIDLPKTTTIPVSTGIPLEFLEFKQCILSDIKSLNDSEENKTDRPELKDDIDKTHFQSLFEEDDGEIDELASRERRIREILLRMKNSESAISRKSAYREFIQSIQTIGSIPIFNVLLPIVASGLNTGEGMSAGSHIYIKALGRLIDKTLITDINMDVIDKILLAISPMLIDADYYQRSAGRDIFSKLSSKIGPGQMILSLRPGMDHSDEYVRNMTARGLAIVGKTCGIDSIVDFLKVTAKTTQSWQIRHTSFKIIQQMGILIGCGVLPQVSKLLEIAVLSVHDDIVKNRTVGALAISSLADACYPYGIECFEPVVFELWKSIFEQRGRALAAVIKAIGTIIPLMDPEHANFYIKELLKILIREFSSPDDELRRTILIAMRNSLKTPGVDVSFFRDFVLDPFIENYWTMRVIGNSKMIPFLIETTSELSVVLSPNEVICRLVEFLSHSEIVFRSTVILLIGDVYKRGGVKTTDLSLERRLMDGLIVNFQTSGGLVLESNSSHMANSLVKVIDAFGDICLCFGERMKPYLAEFAGTIRSRLNTPNPFVRQIFAEVICVLAPIYGICHEEAMLSHISLFLFEYLGEEYPDVLAALLKALDSIAKVIPLVNFTPPVQDLLPRLTPILKNRHEAVQQSVIDLIGVIAKEGGDAVNPKEWTRICFEILELLKADRKRIRRSACLTFGYIAKAIGPHDIVVALLNNLKMQERQIRLCTAIAIAIVAEACGPFTLLPALMNEYRTPELLVQNGILKSLSFLFEYIASASKDYVYALVPLLEDALVDRDIIHRQTALYALKHLSLGLCGHSREDVIVSLFNFAIPNIFEVIPHTIQATLDTFEGARVTLGEGSLLCYILQGLFHPARRVRDVYWRLYNTLYHSAAPGLVPMYPVDILVNSKEIRENMYVI